PHPENANRMPEALLEKLQSHIERTGRYEPLVVRPVPSPVTRGRVRKSQRYQILNGHHRAEVLKALGHTRARCDVWDVDDDEARMLLATLNRLEGRDDPKARARLVAHLATGRSAEDLARLLPEPPDAVERLLRLAEPPPEPAPPDSLEPLPQALVFFLSEEQEVLVREALGAVAEEGAAEGAARLGRAERLERLALWYLESVGRR
ncbi:MAG: ParB/RepB/Spo0J family partition protein, partial [Phycisphaerae bacterium]